MRAHRRTGIPAVLILAALSGCAPSPPPESARWSPPPSAASPVPGAWTGKIAVDGETGTITAPGFNELVDASDPPWSADVRTAAAELLDLDRPVDGPVRIYLEVDGDEVTVTRRGLGDDSVAAERYRVEFTRGDDGRYRFGSGLSEKACHSGRGHQDFGTGQCR